MDPTDPTWMQPTNVPPPLDDGTPSAETSGSEEVEFVDFAETEPVDAASSPEEPPSARQWVWLLLLPFGFTFLLTSLFLAMRGVMDLGGFVASGGPYEIAHEAPGYVWIFPVAIIGCMLIIFTSMGMFSFARGMAGPGGLPFAGAMPFSEGGNKANLVALFFWPAIFLSLGWNFLEYGFIKGEGVAWGWAVCGVVFVVMAVIPLYLVMRKTSGNEMLAAMKRNASVLWPQLIGIAAGIPLGILFFSAVS